MCMGGNDYGFVKLETGFNKKEGGVYMSEISNVSTLRATNLSMYKSEVNIM